jgi:hypothetical protein
MSTNHPAVAATVIVIVIAANHQPAGFPVKWQTKAAANGFRRRRDVVVVVVVGIVRIINIENIIRQTLCVCTCVCALRVRTHTRVSVCVLFVVCVRVSGYVCE